MNELFRMPVFGVLLSLSAYLFGAFLYRKTKFPLFSPIVVATALIMGFLAVSGEPVADYLDSTRSIQLFLGPLIVSLAVPIVRQIDLIKKYLLPILVGSVVGAATSMLSVMWLGPLFGLTPEVIASIMPKSATTPIAVEVVGLLGGIPSIAVFAVVATAILAAAIFPFLYKAMGIKDPLLIGLTLGANAHALGTAKAMEIDKVAGAISGIALVISGIATAILALFL